VTPSLPGFSATSDVIPSPSLTSPPLSKHLMLRCPEFGPWSFRPFLSLEHQSLVALNPDFSDGHQTNVFSCLHDIFIPTNPNTHGPKITLHVLPQTYSSHSSTWPQPPPSAGIQNTRSYPCSSLSPKSTANTASQIMASPFSLQTPASKPEHFRPEHLIIFPLTSCCHTYLPTERM
jgi:hypothetical protein